MSRVAKKPVDLPQGVTATIGADSVTVKGAKGTLTLPLKGGIKVVQKDKHLSVEADLTAEGMNAIAGSTRAHLANMVQGVTQGYERKLELVGVGYRAAVQAKNLTLTLGYSHLINYAIPEGVSIETPSQTEIVVKGIDCQRVGQTAAEIRAFRSPEPYKGKGVKYSDEVISLKEAKKK
jgi:large subunit ribosomal protein L6